MQRANIARALAISPKLVVLDEALSNLDRVLQLQLQLQLQLLQRLQALRRDKGTAFVLINHDLSLVHYFCQRVVVLDAGSIVEDCTVRGDLSFEHPAGKQLQAAVLPERPTKICARVSTSLA